MNFKKALTYLALGTALGYGTFDGTIGPRPVLGVRNENGYGLMANLISANDAEKFYGAVIGVASGSKNVNGIQAGVLTVNCGEINGLNFAVGANLVGKEVNSTINGLELALIANGNIFPTNGFATKVQGVQASVFYNEALVGSKGLQIGIMNFVKDEQGKVVSWNPLFNVMAGYNPQNSKLGAAK
jgi:PAS domain-containing protein